MSDDLQTRVAAALYDDNLRQINANNRKRYDDHLQQTGERLKSWNGTAWEPADFVEMIQTPFAEAEEHCRAVYLSYARAAIAEIDAASPVRK